MRTCVCVCVCVRACVHKRAVVAQHAHLALFLGTLLAAKLNKVGVRSRLGLDEAPLEVIVNHSGRLQQFESPHPPSKNSKCQPKASHAKQNIA